MYSSNKGGDSVLVLRGGSRRTARSNIEVSLVNDTDVE
jgi:hypothetical protein